MSDHLIQQYPEWREAVRRFHELRFAPGDILTFEWLYEAFQITRPVADTLLSDAQKAELRFLGQFKEFEDALLREHQTALANVRGVGYRIVPPSEQTAWAERSGVSDIKKAVRRLGDRLTNVDLARLSSVERQQNADALARLAMLSGMTKAAIEHKNGLATIDE
jgi:hypothetical protein